jgi:hypothetical protein
MRVRLIVGVRVVSPVGSDPARRRVLHAANSENGKGVLQRLRTDHAAMGQQPVKAKTNSERAEEVKPDERENDAGPADQPRHKRQEGEQMHGENPAGVDPGQAPRLRAGWKR